MRFGVAWGVFFTPERSATKSESREDQGYFKVICTDYSQPAIDHQDFGTIRRFCKLSIKSPLMVKRAPLAAQSLIGQTSSRVDLTSLTSHLDETKDACIVRTAALDMDNSIVWSAIVVAHNMGGVNFTIRS